MTSTSHEPHEHDENHDAMLRRVKHFADLYLKYADAQLRMNQIVNELGNEFTAKGSVSQEKGILVLRQNERLKSLEVEWSAAVHAHRPFGWPVPPQTIGAPVLEELFGLSGACLGFIQFNPDGAGVLRYQRVFDHHFPFPADAVRAAYYLAERFQRQPDKQERLIAAIAGWAVTQIKWKSRGNGHRKIADLPYQVSRALHEGPPPPRPILCAARDRSEENVLIRHIQAEGGKQMRNWAIGFLNSIQRGLDKGRPSQTELMTDKSGDCLDNEWHSGSRADNIEDLLKMMEELNLALATLRSPLELQVFLLKDQGFSVREMADKLGTDENQIKNTVERVRYRNRVDKTQTKPAA